jgi:ATP-binding cassette subfamily F protein 3
MAQAKVEERESKGKLKEYQDQLKKTQSLNIELGSAKIGVYSLVDVAHGKLSLMPPLTETEITLQKDLTFRITTEDKAIIAGRNGSGKSSLMKAIQQQPGYILSAKIPPIFPKESLYIDQHYSLIQPNKTLITHIGERAPQLEYEEIRKILGNYLFTREDQINQDATTLSGGEKARLALAMASVSQRTLLLLDEPTNNLDNESVEELIFALNNYIGGVLLISHDIGFIKKLTLTQDITL